MASRVKSNVSKNLAKIKKDMPGMALQAMDYSMTQAENIAKSTTVFKDRSGRLRNSINGGISQVVGTVIIGGVGAGQPDATGDLAATMEYAPRIELGFVGTDKLGRHYNQMPRPFIWPAIMQVRAQGLLQRALKSLMEAWRPI